MGVSVRLEPLTEVRLGACEQREVQGHAALNVQAGYWVEGDALERVEGAACVAA